MAARKPGKNKNKEEVIITPEILEKLTKDGRCFEERHDGFDEAQERIRRLEGELKMVRESLNDSSKEIEKLTKDADEVRQKSERLASEMQSIAEAAQAERVAHADEVRRLNVDKTELEKEKLRIEKDIEKREENFKQELESAAEKTLRIAASAHACLDSRHQGLSGRARVELDYPNFLTMLETVPSFREEFCYTDGLRERSILFLPPSFGSPEEFKRKITMTLSSVQSMLHTERKAKPAKGQDLFGSSSPPSENKPKPEEGKP